MPDALGYRMKFGVLVPSTNTIVQPEYDDMRVPGVTNHIGRITLPNMQLRSDADFLALIDAIKAAMMPAVDQLMTCQPNHVILGMSAETFWDGLDGSRQLDARLRAQGAPGVTLGSDACQAALRAYGGIKRLGVVTPYMPIGDTQVRRFFRECGYEVGALIGLKCASPVAIAEVSEARLRDAVNELAQADVDAIVQVGTNLAMAEMAPKAEAALGKPVIAINTATYWHALRQNGIADKVQGFGRLLSEF